MYRRFGFGSFGFDVQFRFPPGYFKWYGPWPFPPSPTREEYLKELKRYRDDLKKELEEVEAEIKEWEK